ncbi:MAG: hypothetical protein ACOX81_10020 [Candidatus Heteroscillospira sp.]|jgi:hypothetical protein
MATIRRKTIEKNAGAFLKYAREQGIALSWDRYERMLPQDGFARLGLTCADCPMGPCRISPFDRDEPKTVCGMDKADLVYRSVMRMMWAEPGYTREHMASIMGRVEELCGAPGKSSNGQTPIGYGVLDEEYINICAEMVPFARLGEIEAAAEKAGELAASVGAKGFKFSLVGGCCYRRSTVGGFADIEFAILTGLVDGYILGAHAAGLGRNAAAHYPTAVACAQTDADEILKRAAQAFAARDKSLIRPESEVVTVPMHSLEKLSEIAAGYDKVAIVGGGAIIKRTTGESAVETIRALTAKGVACFVFGSAIIAAAKAGLTEHVYASGASVSDVVFHKGIMDKAAVACMPEISCGGGFAKAMYMGEKGLKVLTCTELPVEGCPELADEIHKRVAYCGAGEYVGKVLEIVG